jgi:hypothetical protein
MSNESIPDTSEKQRIWENYQQTVERIRGVLGNPVGEAVKESVIGLNLLGVRTILSGEGRMEDFRRATAPFIDIEASDAESLRKTYIEEHADIGYNHIAAESLREIIARKNLEERAKLVPILDKFYQERRTPYDTRLIIESWKDNMSHLTNQGASLQILANDADRSSALHRYQEEMRTFGEFLKHTFLAE